MLSLRRYANHNPAPNPANRRRRNLHRAYAAIADCDRRPLRHQPARALLIRLRPLRNRRLHPHRPRRPHQRRRPNTRLLQQRRPRPYHTNFRQRRPNRIALQPTRDNPYARCQSACARRLSCANPNRALHRRLRRNRIGDPTQALSAAIGALRRRRRHTNPSPCRHRERRRARGL